ncbi:MAG: RNA polymerase sigma factor [bacterium]|nr:RNA polymerase sigma factor [bacterium]
MKTNAKLEILLTEISTGNKDSLEKLYNLINKNVFGYAFSILSNIHDAEDVTQDTFINIYKHAVIYKNNNKPMAWILTITKNLSLNKLKKKSHTSFAEIGDISFSETTEEKIMVDTLLNTLSDEERQIVILKELNGLKYHEISRLLKINISTVLSKYHRAIKKIRSKFGKEMIS